MIDSISIILSVSQRLYEEIILTENRTRSQYRIWCGCMHARSGIITNETIPVTESDRYAVCKQLSYHLGSPLDSEIIWSEVLAVRPESILNLRSFLDTCITSCNKTDWIPADQIRCTGNFRKAWHCRHGGPYG